MVELSIRRTRTHPEGGVTDVVFGLTPMDATITSLRMVPDGLLMVNEVALTEFELDAQYVIWAETLPGPPTAPHSATISGVRTALQRGAVPAKPLRAHPWGLGLGSICLRGVADLRRCRGVGSTCVAYRHFFPIR